MPVSGAVLESCSSSARRAGGEHVAAQRRGRVGEARAARRGSCRVNSGNAVVSCVHAHRRRRSPRSGCRCWRQRRQGREGLRRAAAEARASASVPSFSELAVPLFAGVERERLPARAGDRPVGRRRRGRTRPRGSPRGRRRRARACTRGSSSIPFSIAAQVVVEPRLRLAEAGVGAGRRAVVGADDDQVRAVVAKLLVALERAARLDVEEARRPSGSAGRWRRRGSRARATSRRASGAAGRRARRRAAPASASSAAQRIVARPVRLRERRRADQREDAGARHQCW